MFNELNNVSVENSRQSQCWKRPIKVMCIPHNRVRVETINRLYVEAVNRVSVRDTQNNQG